MERRREERLTEIEREQTINLVPPKKIVAIKLLPNHAVDCRLIVDDYVDDYVDIVKEYERVQERQVIKTLDNIGLVDFISEEKNGDVRYIILTDQTQYHLPKHHCLDLHDIINQTYVYCIVNEKAEKEIKLGSYPYHAQILPVSK
jgi:hypothetical protein